MWVTLQGPLPRAGEKKRAQEPWAELPKPSPEVMLQRGSGIAPVGVRAWQRDSSGSRWDPACNSLLTCREKEKQEGLKELQGQKGIRI